MRLKVDTAKQTSTLWLVAGCYVWLVAIGALVIAQVLPAGMDWYHTYRPATRQIIAGQSPYDDLAFYSPPWTAIPLLPLALLPPAVGRGAVFVLNLSAYTAVALKLGARPVSVVLILLSPLTLHCLLNANIDWLILLALFLPARWGLFLALIKPQVGAGLVVYWAAEAWRMGRWRTLVAVFGPLMAATLLSFVLYGLWPLHARATAAYTFNASLFPASAPVGVALLLWAMRRHDYRPALAASPMLAPYVLFHSWIGAVIVLSHKPWLLAFVVAVLWGLVALAA